MGLAEAELHEARARALGLLATLFSDGPGQEHLNHLRAIPVLRPHLTDVDPDMAAATHYAVLGRAVLPYESVFLSPSATLGGEHTEWWAEHGAVSCHGLAADHLGIALTALSEACGQGDVQRQAVLAGRLLGWLAPLQLAIEETEDGLYSAAAKLSIAIVAELGTPPTDTLAPVPDLLDLPQTGLKHIARILCTPVYLGAYLGPTTLERLGRSVDLPTGFGPRVDVLENLFHAAAHYGRVESLVAGLDDLLDRWQQALGGAQAERWVQRLGNSRALLNQMQTRLSAPR